MHSRSHRPGLAALPPGPEQEAGPPRLAPGNRPDCPHRRSRPRRAPLHNTSCQKVLPLSSPASPALQASPQRPVPPEPAASPGAKSKGKHAPKEGPKGPEVCTDPALLATYAMGVNYLKDSPEVALKPDSEYPDWLFKIHLGPPKKLEELDPNSIEYWRRLRKYNTWHLNKLKKGKKL
uniref:Large ribosomal subunit protein mL54 n=1 Tax=Strix occidentalis caurina TaxID=311401 RepID=A0A8D0FRJ7_STROC